MLTKTQFKILSVFQKDLFSNLTFKQIKEKSKQKSNNIIQIALNEFLKENLLLTNVVGNITTYKLNLDNNLTLALLNTINEYEINKKKYPKTILTEIQKKISKYTEFFILIVFGSYAKNKANDNSDIDIAIIVESEDTKKNIIPLIETIKRREIKKIDYHIFTRFEYIEMLNADSENLGKQIYTANIIYTGYNQFISLIKANKK